MKTREEWREILARHYEVSNWARVKRARPGKGTRMGKILRQTINAHGYPTVMLCVCGTMVLRYVHKLVAEAFLGDCPVGHRVAWKDGDRTNCRLENLHYVPKKGAKHVTPARANTSQTRWGDYDRNRKSFETGF